ncbi:MAG: ESX secretion-associated protein EspG [Saccharothrix sp.]|nr:ESX secretion-associated protein EspG [Saccharothrix sp.]
MTGDEHVCSVATLDLVGQALGVDVRRFPFAFPTSTAGRTEPERLGSAARAHRELVDRDLVRGGRFAPEFEDAVRLFALAPRAVALTGSAAVAVAAFDDERGVLAVADGAAIRFRPTPSSLIVPALTGLLPHVPPGPGASVTVAPGDTTAARRILGRPRYGSGCFLITAPARRPEPVSWLDTDVGRYAAVVDTGRDGPVRATYTPADRAWLIRRLDAAARTGRVTSWT